MSAGPDQRRTESSDATGHVRGSYTFIDDKGVQHTVHYIAGPETGYRVLKNVKAPHFPNWYPLEPSRPSRPPSLPPSPGARPGLGPPPPDFGGEDYGDGDKNIEDIFGGPQEQLSTAASGHAKPSKPPGFGASAEKEDKTPPFDNDFGGSFDEAVGGRPGSTPRPPFNGGGKPSFLDEEGEGGFLPTSTRRPFGAGGPSKPSFLDEEGEGGFGGRPGRPEGTRPPFGGGDEDLGGFFPKPSSTRKPFGGGAKPFDETGPGFGATGEAGRPSSAQADGDFMDDLFKPSGPTAGGGGGPSRDEGKRPSRPQDFGFEGGPSRPSSTRPPFGEVPKPFDGGEGGASAADDFELFGDKGKPSGRPTFTGSKEDMNYGFFDGKGPAARPPQRPGDDFFGEKGPTTARPGGGRPFDFFDEEKGRPSKPTGAGGSKDDFDFFGNIDKGSTARPFRPTPGGNVHDDGYSFTQREPATSRPPTIPSRPTFTESESGRPSIPSRPPYISEGEGRPSRPPYIPEPPSEASRPPFIEPSRPPGRPPYIEPSRPSRPPFIEPSRPSRPPFIEPSRPSRPPFPEGEGQPPGEISGSINVAYDGKVTILTNIGDKHISFPPGVAVKAYVQSIDFLPYGSRIPSPSEQLKSESQLNNDISVQPLKRQLFALNESKQILTINESPEISVQPLRKQSTRDISDNISIAVLPTLQNDSFSSSLEDSEEINEVQQYKRETKQEPANSTIIQKSVPRQMRIKIKHNEIKSDND